MVTQIHKKNGTQKSQMVLKKHKAGGLTLPRFKTYYKAQ